MRITLNLPADLIAEARRATGIRGTRRLVITALEELIDARRRAALLAMLGNTDFDMTWEEIHRLREDDTEGDADEPIRLMLPPGNHPLLSDE
jgi:Arc/MetJ family transcription regulator